MLFSSEDVFSSKDVLANGSLTIILLARFFDLLPASAAPARRTPSSQKPMVPAAVKGVAFVTGAAQGLGRAIALRLASDGFDVAINDVPMNESLLQDVKREITTNFKRQSAVVVGDVSSDSDVKDMVRSVTQHLGGLDVVRIVISVHVQTHFQLSEIDGRECRSAPAQPARAADSQCADADRCRSLV
jgi:hypothetical protein